MATTQPAAISAAKTTDTTKEAPAQDRSEWIEWLVEDSRRFAESSRPASFGTDPWARSVLGQLREAERSGRASRRIAVASMLIALFSLLVSGISFAAQYRLW